MIVVNVELHSAITGKVTTLYKMIVANKASSRDPKVGDYVAYVGRRGEENIRRIHEKPVRTAEVTGHRRQALPVLNLIGKIIEALGYHSVKPAPEEHGSWWTEEDEK